MQASGSTLHAPHLVFVFLQVTVCKEQAEWARTEKRTFLRQRIELRLAALYLQMQDYPTALSLLGT